MLKLTASAFAEVLARSHTSNGRRFKDLIDHGTSEVFLSLSYPNSEALPGCGKRNEHCEPVVSSDGIAAVRQPLGAHVYDVANVDCIIVHDFHDTS